MFYTIRGADLMGLLPELYRPSLALLTDPYQLTMACGYWKEQLGERRRSSTSSSASRPSAAAFT